MDNKTIWIVVGIILLLLFGMFFGAGMFGGIGSYGTMMNYRGFGGMMSGSNFCSNVGGLWCYPPMSYVGMLLNVLFFVAVVLLIVWLVQRIGDKNGK